jgi:hypothetical protein
MLVEMRLNNISVLYFEPFSCVMISTYSLRKKLFVKTDIVIMLNFLVYSPNKLISSSKYLY